MIDKDHHFALKDAARRFLEEPGFSHVQVEDVMSSVFGLQRYGDKWSQYTITLCVTDASHERHSCDTITNLRHAKQPI